MKNISFISFRGKCKAKEFKSNEQLSIAQIICWSIKEFSPGIPLINALPWLVDVGSMSDVHTTVSNQNRYHLNERAKRNTNTEKISI